MVSRAYGPGQFSPAEKLENMLKRGPMTREQIAAALGRSTASETLSRLRKEGRIIEADGEITLKEAQ